jgi:hypothetical protein
MRSIVLLLLAACGSPARATSTTVTPAPTTVSAIPTVVEPCPVVVIDAKRVPLPWLSELDKDTDEPTADAKDALDALAGVMAEYPPIDIGVIGHASVDETKPDALAEARARRVRYELVMRGVDASRVEAHGAGTRRPLDRKDQHKNRYVSTEVIAYGKPLQSWNGTDYQDLPFSSDPARDPCPRPR